MALLPTFRTASRSFRRSPNLRTLQLTTVNCRPLSSLSSSLLNSSISTASPTLLTSPFSSISSLNHPLKFSISQFRSYHYDHDCHLPKRHATTIITVRKGNDVVVIGDGQMSAGSTISKDNVKKVRLLGNNSVICGFAGSTADCMTLFDHLEKKLQEYPNQLLRAAVELAKMWRTDKMLRNLQASIIAVDASDTSLEITGDGNVISEEAEGIISIGSGSLFARSAAKALMTTSGNFQHNLDAREIALRSMVLAAEICVYTNKNFVIQQFKNGKLIEGEEKIELEKRDKEIIRGMEEWRIAQLAAKQILRDQQSNVAG